MKNRWSISATTNQSMAVKPPSNRVPAGTLIIKPCSECSAPAGVQCVTSTGGARGVHKSRKHQAMQAYLSNRQGV
jgi:hypothetical protein